MELSSPRVQPVLKWAARTMGLLPATLEATG
jgi:hypothetical protein